jgi:hypothetical protein
MYQHHSLISYGMATSYVPRIEQASNKAGIFFCICVLFPISLQQVLVGVADTSKGTLIMTFLCPQVAHWHLKVFERSRLWLVTLNAPGTYKPGSYET